MAAPTFVDIPGRIALLETQTIVNQTANTATIVKGIKVPSGATHAYFYLNPTLVAGTTGLLDFKLEVLNPFNIDTAQVTPLGDWDGITQVTNTTNQLIVIEVGPDVTTDDTGSATASCRYGVRAVLPSLLMYTITTDGTTDDEDYTFTLGVEFKGPRL